MLDLTDETGRLAGESLAEAGEATSGALDPSATAPPFARCSLEAHGRRPWMLIEEIAAAIREEPFR